MKHFTIKALLTFIYLAGINVVHAPKKNQHPAGLSDEDSPLAYAGNLTAITFVELTTHMMHIFIMTALLNGALMKHVRRLAFPDTI